MKRLCLMGMAVLSLIIAGLASVASAKTTRTSIPPATIKVVKTTKLVTIRTSCKLSLVTQIPSNDTSVLAGADAGTQFGFAGCGAPLSRGVEHDTFSLETSGNLTGIYQQWYGAGSVFGTYTLAPSAGQPPSSTTFTAESYTGTSTVHGGSGLLKGASGKATLTCSTLEAAHYSCTDNLTLKRKVTVTVKVKVK